MTGLARGREVFEQWAKAAGLSIARQNELGILGAYVQWETLCSWAAWKAAAERTARLEEALREIERDAEKIAALPSCGEVYVLCGIAEVARRALAGEP